MQLIMSSPDSPSPDTLQRAHHDTHVEDLNTVIWTTIAMEILVELFTVAAKIHPSMSPNLCLVSKWTRNLVVPLLYRNVLLKGFTSICLLTESPASLDFLRHHADSVTLVHSCKSDEERRIQNFVNRESTIVGSATNHRYFIAMKSLWSTVTSYQCSCIHITVYVDYLMLLGIRTRSDVAIGGNMSSNEVRLTILSEPTEDTTMMAQLNPINWKRHLAAHAWTAVTHLHFIGLSGYGLLPVSTQGILTIPRLTHVVWSISWDIYTSDSWHTSLYIMAKCLNLASRPQIKLIGFHLVVDDYQRDADYRSVCAEWRQRLERFQFPEDRLAIWVGHGDWDLSQDGPEFWAQCLGRD
jgi:hypothetical protein